MSANVNPWLAGRRALVVGRGAGVDAIAAAIERAGGEVRRAEPDLVDAPGIEAVLDKGDVDLLVHAGTKLPRRAPESIHLDAWRETFSADVDGRFLFAAAFARRIIGAPGRHGAILFLLPALRPVAGSALAATGHGAIDNLVKSLAVEWARDGIRVNAIASRTVEDFGHATPEAQGSLANLAAWLLSDHAAYMTGAVSGIDELV